MTKAPHLQLLFYEAFAALLYAYGNTCFHSPFYLDFYVPVIICIAVCAPLCGANIFPSVTLSNFLRKENKY